MRSTILINTAKNLIIEAYAPSQTENNHQEQRNKNKPRKHLFFKPNIIVLYAKSNLHNKQEHKFKIALKNLFKGLR